MPTVRTLRRWRTNAGLGPQLTAVFDPCYRLALTTLHARTGFDPRRAELVIWWLLAQGWIAERTVRKPLRCSYEQLGRVHSQRWLEALSQPETLAQIMGADAWDVDVDAILETLRAAVGGTMLAARLAQSERRPVLNLFGGLHHAFPDSGGGMCPLNDIAVTVAQLRSEGWRGRVSVIDLDAHPPDGTRASLLGIGETLGQGDGSTAWIGSLSGSDWGPLPGIDETVLAERCGDALYLQALDALLDRMPLGDLTFVVAGGDVLQGDPVGRLGLTLTGIRQRDRKVVKALGRTPSVWLPAGGYTADAWRILAGTALELLGSTQEIPADADPLADHFRWVSRSLRPEELGDWSLDGAEIEAELGGRPAPRPRLLGFYTATGLEFALYRLELLRQIERLGYHDLRVTIAKADPGDRLSITGRFGGDPTDHHLVEVVLERLREPGGEALFVHWLELRHPRGAWAQGRPPLPGQSAPGLGLARECGELLVRIAERLGLTAVVMRPAWFHVAYTARYRLRFVQDAVQGRFEALVRDLQACAELQRSPGGFQLAAASRAIAEGRVMMQRDGHPAEPYQWQTEEMRARVPPQALPPAVGEEREHVRFWLREVPPFQDAFP